MTTQNSKSKIATTSQSLATMDMKTLILTQPKKQFIASGGTEEQFIREAGFALQIIRNNSYLEKMDRMSIVDAIVNVALTGLSLNPVLKLGYLVPFKGKLYFWSSYMGKIEILMRSGIVSNIWVSLVHEKDSFTFNNGDNKEIIHKPDSFSDRGQVIGGYWVAVLPNGAKMMDTMTIDRIKEIRDRSEAVKAGKGSPWDTDFEEMCKKTIINNAFKFIPKTGISDSVLKVLNADISLDEEQMKQWRESQDATKKHDFEDDAPADDIVHDAEIVEDFPAASQEKEPEKHDSEPQSEPPKSAENKENTGKLPL